MAAVAVLVDIKRERHHLTLRFLTQSLWVQEVQEVLVELLESMVAIQYFHQ